MKQVLIIIIISFLMLIAVKAATHIGFDPSIFILKYRLIEVLKQIFHTIF